MNRSLVFFVDSVKSSAILIVDIRYLDSKRVATHTSDKLGKEKNLG